ncbi:MAG: CRISPR-associated endonuclease Cas1 [Bacteroidota bacterium]
MRITVNTYGTYLHVKNKMFEIRVPQKEVKKAASHFYAAHKIKSIVLSTGTALSSDAVRLAMQYNVDIVFTEGDGHPLGRVWHSKLGSTTKIRKKQLETSLSKKGVIYVKEWLSTKLENQRNFIQDLKKHRPQHQAYLDDKIARIEALVVSLQSLEGETTQAIADTLRGLEGTAGRLYFETLSYVLPAAYQFQGRSSRPAKDAFNACLNYAYGIMYSQVEKALIIAGLDPYVGFLHRDDYNQLSFVYDFIEPYRIHAERTVFRLFSGKKINQTHTMAITNGVSLIKEGKALLVDAYSQYVESDKIRYRGRNQTRSNILQYEAHRLANELIATTPNDNKDDYLDIIRH